MRVELSVRDGQYHVAVLLNRYGLSSSCFLALFMSLLSSAVFSSISSVPSFSVPPSPPPSDSSHLVIFLFLSLQFLEPETCVASTNVSLDTASKELAINTRRKKAPIAEQGSGTLQLIAVCCSVKSSPIPICAPMISVSMQPAGQASAQCPTMRQLRLRYIQPTRLSEFKNAWNLILPNLSYIELRPRPMAPSNCGYESLPPH